MRSPRPRKQRLRKQHKGMAGSALTPHTDRRKSVDLHDTDLGGVHTYALCVRDISPSHGSLLVLVAWLLSRHR